MRLIAALLLSCLLTMVASAQQMGGLPTVQWSMFRTGQNAQIKTFQTRVISTEGAWQTFYRQLTGEPASNAPRGANWATEELWVIVLGERKTGGYGVFVRNAVHVNARDIEVTFVEQTPAPGGVATQAITSPFVVVKANRTGGVPRFVRGNSVTNTVGGGSILYPVYPDYGNQGPIPIRWGLLDRGLYSPINETRTFFLATRREFDEYARQVFPRVEGMDRLSDDVRWSDEMIVAIHAGSKSRSTTIEIDRVVLEGNSRVLIQWYEHAGLDSRAGRCSPYLLMRIPRLTTAPIVRKVLGATR